MKFKEHANKYRGQLEQNLKLAKSELRKMPKGNIRCRRRGDNWRWYYECDGTEKSLSKIKQKSLAEKLAYKKQLQQQIEEIETELATLERFALCENQIYKTNEEIERLAGEYYKRIHPAIAEFQEQLRAAHEDNIQRFAGREIDKIQYKIKSNFGLRFRSKSEALIYERLRNHNLLVFYERDLMLSNGKMRSPDFTIYNAATGEYIIWEHFGMMDNPGYQESTITKLREYFQSGYIPGVNMIATFETSDNAIDLQYIEMLIETFFE
ncbi:MAG: hypothetical protein KBS56_00120 [Clostridiales bacterium]|nr:hypothetical protein [Candidatus Crickella equi]